MPELIHVPGRVIVKVDMDAKNSHRFSNGVTIRLERDYNNLDRKYTKVSQGVVISGENIESGSAILFHPNGATDTYRIFNYTSLSGEEIASNIRYFSIPEDQCYIWKDASGEWQPLDGYATALRIFKPYTGVLHGIEPTKISKCLYVTNGKYKGNAVQTLVACDYEMIFNDSDGREKRIIRFRPDGDEKTNREAEAIAVLHGVTNKIKQGKYLIGLTTSDAKTLKQNVSYAV